MCKRLTSAEKAKRAAIKDMGKDCIIRMERVFLGFLRDSKEGLLRTCK